VLLPVSSFHCDKHYIVLYCLALSPGPGVQSYVVLNRPWAFVQWLERAFIKEE